MARRVANPERPARRLLTGRLPPIPIGLEHKKLNALLRRQSLHGLLRQELLAPLNKPHLISEELE